MMHISFFTDRMDEMIDFYTNKLGGQVKIVTKAKRYLEKEGHPYQKIALKDPEKIIITYIEIAPGQFIELFPKGEGQLDHDENWNARLGYSHFALTVDDIHQTRDELASRGVPILVEPNIGNSHTWQMWCEDPDGNRFEIMQYTEDSYQLVGHIDD